MPDSDLSSRITPETLAPWADDTYAGCLALVAQARGLPIRRLDITPLPGRPPASWLAFQVGRRHYLFRGGMLLVGGRLPDLGGFGRVNGEMAELSANKAATRLVVAALGGPVAEGAMFRRNELVLALRFFRRLGRPACLKPNGARAGIGIVPWVVDDAAFAAAFRRLAQDHSRILVEEQLEGTVVRYQYTRPSIVGVRIDRPASVVGDGATSVAALVGRKNADPVRSRLPNHSPIPLGPENLRELRRQGFGPDDVLPAGRRVFLSALSNMENGADCLSWPERVHPSYPAEVERICRAFAPYRFGSIDTIVRDPSVPATPGNHWILEINSVPGFSSFYLPLEGTPQDVCGPLLDRLRDEQW